MIRLTTLGTIELRTAAGTSVESVIRQPRRFALLVYLALESRRGFVRRDRILGLFWPETTQEKGRNALSQALYHLRQSLGEELVVNRGSEEVQLDLSRVDCDLCAFLDRAEGADPEGAVRLFGGEFLPGFFCAGAPEFEDWMHQTRSLLRRAASNAGWAAAEQASGRGELVTAAANARRAAELADGDEASVRRLMTFLAGLGDRAGALEAFEALTRRLERELEARPSEATQRLAADIRKATSVPDEPVPAALPVAPAPAPFRPAVTAAPPATAAGWRRHALTVRSYAVSAALMFGIISLWGLTREDTEASPFSGDALVVVESAEGATGLGAALTSSIVQELDNATLIDVIPAGDLPAVRNTRGPEFRLRTTLVPTDGGTEANVVVVDIGTGKTIGSTRVAARGASMDDMRRMGHRVAIFARKTVGEELDRRRAQLADVDADVIVAYSGAKRLKIVADSLMDVEQREVARVQLATADSQLAVAEREAPDWSELPIARAELAMERMWAHLVGKGASVQIARDALRSGITYADRALALDASDARGLEMRGVLRYWLWGTAPPKTPEAGVALRDMARRDLERATELDPGSAKAWNILSSILFSEGEFAEAYVAADKAYEADRFLENATAIRIRLFWSALEVQNIAAATRWCDATNADEPDSWRGSYCRLVLEAWSEEPVPGGLERSRRQYRLAVAARDLGPMRPTVDGAFGVVLARHGKTKEALQVVADLLPLADQNPEVLTDIAWIYSVLNDATRAGQALDRYIAGSPPARAGIAKSGRFTYLSAGARNAGVGLDSSRSGGPGRSNSTYPRPSSH